MTTEINLFSRLGLFYVKFVSGYYTSKQQAKHDFNYLQSVFMNSDLKRLLTHYKMYTPEMNYLFEEK